MTEKIIVKDFPFNDGYDSNDVDFLIKEVVVGKGYRGKDGKLHIMRCPQCLRENYAMQVGTGLCAWCGLDSNTL